MPEPHEQPPGPARRATARRELRRAPKQVIDQAIRDNKAGERLLYFYSVSIALVGLAVLVWGVYKESNVLPIVGACMSGLFIPAVRLARSIRRENIAIRLLEAPLSLAETATEAASTLNQFFLDTFNSKRPSP